MKQAYILSLVIVSLFCFTSSTLAVVIIPNPLNGVNSFPDLLLRIAGAVGTLIASLGTIMIIVAGILYLTSAGSPERMGKAKTTLIYAIVGICIGIAATTIVTIIKNILGA